MANKITLTRNDKYIETSTKVNITGSNLKNKYALVSYSDKRIDDIPNWEYELTPVKITNNTSFSFDINLTQNLLDNIYLSTINTDTLRTNVLIVEVDGSFDIGYTIITNYSFVSYIEPQEPIFDGTPTYLVTDNNTIALTNNTSDIINGMSTVEISNIKGTAYKSGEIKYIKVGSVLYDYNNYVQQNKLTISNLTIPKGNYFDIFLIDSRGWESRYETFKSPMQIKSYHKPIITDFVAERDVASAVTKLVIKGIYTEGYESGVESLVPSYKYQEITSDGSASIENGRTTQHTITRTATSEWEDYLRIKYEIDNPRYQRETIDGKVYTYYTASIWNSNINSLFNIALKYNNQYTREYLEQDFDSTKRRYYIKSGHYKYTRSWFSFWRDTLNYIEQKMYGSYIYGQQDKDYGNGGNYLFEIEMSDIKGDLEEGFTLDKAFNIWGYIDENTFKEAVATTLLSTAIPAVDIYKDKVALHGLYDDTISDSDVQMWGNIFLNGVKINAGMLQAFKTSDTTSYNTSYAYFSPFNGDGDSSVDISNTDKLTFGKKSVTYGDRTNNSVYGVTIGSNINLIKVTFHVRYLNNSSTTTGVNTIVYKNNNGNSDIVFGTASFAPTSMRLTETGICYIEVEEGDFIFIGGFRATKSSNVDVIATNNNTSMIVEIIS